LQGLPDKKLSGKASPTSERVDEVMEKIEKYWKRAKKQDSKLNKTQWKRGWYEVGRRISSNKELKKK
jgi:hypothetical protein